MFRSGLSTEKPRLQGQYISRTRPDGEPSSLKVYVLCSRALGVEKITWVNLFKKIVPTLNVSLAFIVIKYILAFIGIFLVVLLIANGIPVLKSEQKENIVFLKPETDFVDEDSVTIRVPAVTKDDDGVMVEIVMNIIPGTGKTLMNIDNILFFEDTQNSIRLSKSIAENITGVRLYENDVIYSVNAEASIIEGSSAGAAISISTVAAIQHKTINKTVTMTGFLKPDGTIGRVSHVFEKAKVSKENGYELILVPPGQKVQEDLIEEEVCTNIIFKEYCRKVIHKKIIDVEKAAKINVIEISNINEAMEYLII